MLPTADLIVLFAYLAIIVGVGLWFSLKHKSTDEFMAAGRALPGWAVGLSMFGSYVSSISFLANPGKAYAGNWNAFVFSLAAPLAAAVAVRWFMPFYRRTGEISAYEHLEYRFGPWARTYAVLCFLLVQMGRMGTVIYLLALAVSPLTGWQIPTTILVTGALMTFYTMAGGIKAVVWTGVLQSAVLVSGTLLCLAAIILKTPGGLGEILLLGRSNDKFSLGSFGGSLTESTFWVVFIYGIVVNLGNFGVDQSYIQRYLTASDDREAAKSIWITALLYVPTAAVYFFIGTGLYVFYGLQPDLAEGVDKADKMFPHFIAHELPAGLAGLVVAAIFAASMDSNLNSMATLTLCDLYKRYLRQNAGERESMRVLYLATLFWGAAGIGVAFAMIRADKVLDAWWNLVGIFSGGVLGLFLLGLIVRRAGSAAGAIATIIGLLVIAWLALPSALALFPNPPELPAGWRNPLHAYLTIVIGTLTIFFVGLAAAMMLPAKNHAGPLSPNSRDLTDRR